MGFLDRHGREKTRTSWTRSPPGSSVGSYLVIGNNCLLVLTESGPPGKQIVECEETLDLTLDIQHLPQSESATSLSTRNLTLVKYGADDKSIDTRVEI